MSQLQAPVGPKNPQPEKALLDTNIASGDLIAQDMHEVNLRIRTALQSDVVLINQMGNYIIGAGGKRLRPQLVLLSSLAQGYSGKHHTNIAAVIEFIHTATLLHDDVVDSSSLRRGRETAHTVWGNEAAVLVGDFLYSRAFEMMVEVGQMRVMEILSAATNTIASGEVMQLMNIGESNVTEQHYKQVISAKTGKLFEAAAQLGSVLVNAPLEQEQNMASYGAHLGIAFQLIDDVLDYTARTDEMGKNAGDDLLEGKPTLPLIYALETLDSSAVESIKQALAMAQRDGLPAEQVMAIVELVCQSGAIERSVEQAQIHVDLAISALNCLPDSEYKNALTTIAESSLERRF